MKQVPKIKLRKRPRIISVTCYVGYVWALVGLAFMLKPEIKHLGALFPALFGLIISLRFISYVGIYHLKKWGFELMILAFCSDFALSYAVNQLSIINIILGSISLIIFSFYYNRMQENL